MPPILKRRAAHELQGEVMDQELVARVRKTLEDRPTEELRELYASRDQSAWSFEAFEAMRQILSERGDLVPPRKEVAPPPSLPQQFRLPSTPLFPAVGMVLIVIGSVVLFISCIVVVKDVRFWTVGGWLAAVQILLPPVLIFSLGAILYVLAKIALRLGVSREKD